MGYLWFLIWQLAGIYIAFFAFRQKRLTVRLWLGSVFGSMLSMWMPVVFSFFLGFTVASHLASLLAGAAAVALGLIIVQKKKIANTSACKVPFSYDLPLLTMVLPVFLFCAWMVFTHTLQNVDGTLYTGQCTYGDMSMHLGFISSIAEQGIFPPEYSILPGERLCYPFLCDSISSSMYLLGTSLRMSYIIPVLFAFAQILCGVWFLGREICLSRKSAVLSWILFFFNGGLGIIYFGKGKDYSFRDLLTGFYRTPTNLINKQMRWVNVIADMLLPQRATLFGWAALMACFYLLFRAVFRADRKLWLPAGILGGLLPMIHTHSFFALGLMAFCWLVYSVCREEFSRDIIFSWMKFGFAALALAMPQLLLWTLRSVSGNSHFLRYHFDWVNGGSENWLWFWLRNVGPVFLLFPLLFFFAPKEKRAVASGSIFIFLLCEFLVFQPNEYDNNKLLYIGYLFALFLTSDGLLTFLAKLKKPLSACLLAVFLLISTNAGVLTLLREGLSGIPEYGYELFNKDEVAAAEFIKENTAPNAVFLTSDNHDNTVAVLTGRNIMCGSSSYLYFHGVDYQGSQQLAKSMLTNAQIFEAYKDAANIDYVYISHHELAVKDNISDYFARNYPAVFSSGSLSIYQIH